MKIFNAIMCVGLCLSFGCDKSEDNVPATSFNVKTHKLIETEEFVAFHVTVEAPEDRYVRVSVMGKVLCEGGFINARSVTHPLQFELTLVATLIKRSDSPNMIKWYIQAEGAGQKIGHPEINETSVQTLSEALSLNRIEGPHSLGQDIILGEFQKEHIVISVE
ncbi:MAG: hypothetical protein ACYSUD_08385 [Planctomycetota bacterium]